MADLKISALPASTTPLAGTEVLPVVQGGTTKKVAVSDLTAGRAVAFSSFTSTGGNVMADSTLLTWGNQGQGFQGVNSGGLLRFYGSYAEQARLSSAGFFVTNGDVQIGTAGKGIDFSANGGDVLSQYDEGTWTPTVTATSGTLTTVTATGNYTRIGRCVTASFQVTLTNVGTASGALIVSLPFTAGQFPAIGTGREDQNTGISLQARIQSSSPTVTYVLSYANGTIIATGNVVQCTVTYFV